MHHIKIPVGGARLYCRDMGVAAPPVLLLHAGSGNVAAWHYQWAALARAGLRGIAFDRRGFGRSSIDDPAARYDHADDAMRIADALKLERFHIVGVAAGGGVAVRMALDHPARIASITVACSHANVIDAKRPPSSTAPSTGSADDELSPHYRLAHPAAAARWHHIHAANARAQKPDPAALSRDPARRTTLAALGTIAAPLHWIGGLEDRLAPPALIDHFVAASQAGACHTMIPHVAHAAQWENPALFNAAMIDFIARLGPAPVAAPR